MDFFGHDLPSVEEEDEQDQPYHPDTPRPSELDSDDDLDATLTNKVNQGETSTNFDQGET